MQSKVLCGRIIKGDVVGVYANSTGTNKVAEYAYDAYGNCTIVSQQAGVGTLNPFRYRGYYWDSDLGLYYLQTRYYDPATGRFINADGLEYLDPQTLGGINLYSYCGNNPIMETDPHGTFVLSAIIWGFVIGFILSFTVSAVSQAANNEGEVNWGVAVVEGLFGGLSGALTASGIGGVIGKIADPALDLICNVLTTGIENDWKFTAKDIGTIALQMFISFGVSAKLDEYMPDIDRVFIRYANEQVNIINSKMARGAYRSAIKANNATATAKSLVKQCFTKGNLQEHFLMSGVQEIFDAIIGVLFV